MLPESIKKISSYVNDFSGVLSKTEQSELDALFVTHEQEKGSQVVTVLFPHRKWLQLKDIAMEVFNTAWIGQKDKNDGLLLVVSTEEEKLRIMVGKWLEWIYDMTWCRELIDQKLRPLLHKWEYAEMVRIFHREVSKNDWGHTHKKTEYTSMLGMIWWELSKKASQETYQKWVSVNPNLLVWWVIIFSQFVPAPFSVIYLSIFALLFTLMLIPIFILGFILPRKWIERSTYKFMSFILLLIVLAVATHYKCDNYPQYCFKVDMPQHSSSSTIKSGWSSGIHSNSTSNSYKSSRSSRSSSSSSYSGWGGSTNGSGYGD